MDSDRKSAVSSFYGGRKNSLDALNSDFASHQVPRGSRDDASSFYNPRGSVDLLNGGRSSTAGYNRGSFFHAGREEPLKGGRDEEEESNKNDSVWDVYADFNNTGPMYSAAFGQSEQGYHQLPPSTPKGGETMSDVGPVEMVTVPALGPEWKRSEMHDMTKAGKRERKAESRNQKWKAWNRGERGMCGHYFKRRVFVFFMFGLCGAIAIVLAFTIPRVPSFALSDATPLANATGDWATEVPTIFSRTPANFSFPAVAALQVNTNSNYLPLTFKHLRASIYDLRTNRLVGTGDLGHKTLPAKSFPEIQIPLNFTYIATNSSDQTWLNWYDGCRSKQFSVDGKRPGLEFRLVLDIDIAGLPSVHHDSTQVSDADCPIELSPSNA